MTTQCIGYEEVLRMTDEDREWWAERCEEYQDEMADDVAKAKAGH